MQPKPTKPTTPKVADPSASFVCLPAFPPPPPLQPNIAPYLPLLPFSFTFIPTEVHFSSKSKLHSLFRTKLYCCSDYSLSFPCVRHVLPFHNPSPSVVGTLPRFRPPPQAAHPRCSKLINTSLPRYCPYLIAPYATLKSTIPHLIELPSRCASLSFFLGQISYPPFRTSIDHSSLAQAPPSVEAEKNFEINRA